MNEARRIIADMIALAELKDRRPVPPPPPTQEVNAILVEKFAEIQRQTLDAFTRLSTRTDSPRASRTPSTDEMPDALILAYLEGEEVSRDGDEWDIGGRLYCFSESDDSWESFDADDWVEFQGKRGGKGWRNTKTGRVVYGKNKPGGGRTRKTQEGDSGADGAGAAEKPTKPTPADPQELLAGIKDLQANPDRINEQSIKDAVAKMMTLKQTDINAIKKELGLKAGGTKEKQVRALMDKILGDSGEKTAPPQKTPEAERLGKLEAAFKGLGVELTDDLLADPEKLKGALRAALGGETKGEEKPAQMPPEQLWASIQDAYKKVSDRNQLDLAGMVSIPELTDEVIKATGGKVARDDVHKMLRDQHGENVTLERHTGLKPPKDADETMPTGDGQYYYYLQVRPGKLAGDGVKQPEKKSTDTVTSSTWKVKPGEDFGAFANRVSAGRTLTGEQMQKIRQEFDKQQKPTAPEGTDRTEEAMSRYEAIKNDLGSLSVEEMRSRFREVASMPKTALAGVLSKLGYPADGSREKLAAKLLDNLISLKISHDQTGQITAPPQPKPPGLATAGGKPKAGKVDQGVVDKVRDSILESIQSTERQYDDLRRQNSEANALILREKRKRTPEEAAAADRRTEEGFAIQRAHRDALHSAADQVEQMSQEQAALILKALGEEAPHQKSPAWRSAKKAAEWLRGRGNTAMVAAGDTLA